MTLILFVALRVRIPRLGASASATVIAAGTLRLAEKAEYWKRVNVASR